MFKKYNLEITRLLSGKKESSEWKKILTHHKLMISRIQHERFIHLLVTVFVGICMAMSFLAYIASLSVLLGILTLVLVVLFAAYIFHYRFLENTTQKWYKFEDEISKNINL